MMFRAMRWRVMAAAGVPGAAALSLAATGGCQSTNPRGSDLVAVALAPDAGVIGAADAEAAPDAEAQSLLEPCKQDEIREAICATPRQATAQASAPYETCAKSVAPASASIARRVISGLEGAPPHAYFDAPTTESYRALPFPHKEFAPPPDACCYSWCAAGRAKPAPATSTWAGVTGGGYYGMTTTCIEAPEGGTASSAPDYADCPAGLDTGTSVASFDDVRTKAARERKHPAAPLQPTAKACCYSIAQQHYPVRGRSFRPDGEARTAPERRSVDWLAEIASIDVAAIAPDVRALLAERRSVDAAMEHASVASFSRVSLQLMALGAPPELLVGAHAAALDEIEHARLTYALASAYRGAPCGPAPLDVGALDMDRLTLARFARETFDDACVGETVAALVARRSAEVASSPALRRILSSIADDEERHAELAWRMLAWALRAGGDEVASVIRARASELDGTPPREPQDGALEPHGVLSAVAERAIHARAVVEVIAPCVERLLAP